MKLAQGSYKGCKTGTGQLQGLQCGYKIAIKGERMGSSQLHGVQDSYKVATMV